MGLYRYEAVAAKCRCMFGMLLRDSDYQNLLKCSSVTKLAAYLHDNTHYRDVLANINLERINRNKIEYYIKKTLIDDYMKMYLFTYGNERKFINAMLAKYEFEFILKIWRNYAGRASTNARDSGGEEYITDDGILEINMIYQNNSRMDLSAFRNISGTKDFLDAIKDTDYYDIFIKYMASDNMNYTQIETALYNEYYMNLYKNAGLFEKSTEMNIKNIIATQADLINISRISRMIFSFSSSPEDIARYLLPLKNKLTKADISALIQMPDHDSFLRYCENLYYGQKMSFYEHAGVSLSLYTQMYLYRMLKSPSMSRASDFDIVVKYFYIKDMEIKNLVYLIEGIRYNMSAEEIKKILIGDF